MNVLLVCSGNHSQLSPFIEEQVNSIKDQSINVQYYFVKGRGLKGYLKNLKPLKEKVSKENIIFIHAHFGLSGFLANLQRKVPVVVTFHGTDINNNKNFIISSITSLLSSWNIFVSDKLYNRLLVKKNNFSVIPCGVDINKFFPIPKNEARKTLKLNANAKYFLFASAFDNSVKNPSLAIKAVEQIPNAILIELKNFSRREVMLYLNACDLLLLTSKSEGSPQIIKEALACNCPIVATDVGDIKENIREVKNCYLVKNTVEDVVQKVNFILKNKDRTNGRGKVLNLSLETIARRIIEVYENVLN